MKEWAARSDQCDHLSLDTGFRCMRPATRWLQFAKSVVTPFCDAHASVHTSPIWRELTPDEVAVWRVHGQ